MEPVIVIGAGLAGCEAAWQLAQRGIPVRLREMKPGGTSAAFDELNKFFTISGMPVASSQYWNSIHGREAGEARQDAEGLQTMRTLARNMSFLVKSIALGREKYGLPERETPQRTHFIR